MLRRHSFKRVMRKSQELAAQNSRGLARRSFCVEAYLHAPIEVYSGGDFHLRVEPSLANFSIRALMALLPSSGLFAVSSPPEGSGVSFDPAAVVLVA